MPDLVTLLLQVAAIVVTARLTGACFRRIGQPQVMGEMASGILLGPSLLGWAAPELHRALFPDSSLPFLATLSQVGLMLFLFLVGLEFNSASIRRLGRVAVATSVVSIAAPFALGAGLAWYLYPRLSGPPVTPAAFTLFLGAAMSVTAFPVLARILSERGLTRTPLGTLALACAAVDDVSAWCILTYIVAFVRAANESKPLWATLAGVTVFAAAMIFVARPLLRRFERSVTPAGKVPHDALSAILLLLLLSAAATEWVGVHLLFGAFLFGAALPRDEKFVHAVTSSLESVTLVLLLPIFFAFVGLRTSLGQVGGGGMGWYTALIIAVAVAGKLGGAALAARGAGAPWRTSLALGALMNTRGLMELVILNVGYELGVINGAVFSMMVIMALVTTFITTPLLRAIHPEGAAVAAAPPA